MLALAIVIVWIHCNYYMGRISAVESEKSKKNISALTELEYWSLAHPGRPRHTVILEYFNIKEYALPNLALQSF